MSIHVLCLPSWYPTYRDSRTGIFFREQAIALSHAGCKVGVIYPDLQSLRTLTYRTFLQQHFTIDDFEDDGIPTLYWHGWNPPTEFLRFQLFNRMTLKLVHFYIRKHGVPDVIHAHSALWGGCAAQIISIKINRPYVLTEHASIFMTNSLSLFAKNASTLAFSNARQVITVSRALENCVRTLIPTQNIITIPNLIDTNFFNVKPNRTLSPFRFLAIGNLVPIKGFNILLRAFAIAFKDDPDVDLLLGGAGQEKIRLETLASTLGIAKRVHFIGSLTRAQVRQAMFDADVFVVSSYQETFGIVVIEAMSTGMPVVATKCGGPEEIINATNGWLTDVGNPKALAQALVKAREEADRFDPVAIRSDIIQRFDKKIITDQIVNCYHGIL